MAGLSLRPTRQLWLDSPTRYHLGHEQHLPKPDTRVAPRRLST